MGTTLTSSRICGARPCRGPNRTWWTRTRTGSSGLLTSGTGDGSVCGSTPGWTGTIWTRSARTRTGRSRRAGSWTFSKTPKTSGDGAAGDTLGASQQGGLKGSVGLSVGLSVGPSVGPVEQGALFLADLAEVAPGKVVVHDPERLH